MKTTSHAEKKAKRPFIGFEPTPELRAKIDALVAANPSVFDITSFMLQAAEEKLARLEAGERITVRWPISSPVDEKDSRPRNTREPGASFAASPSAAETQAARAPKADRGQGRSRR